MRKEIGYVKTYNGKYGYICDKSNNTYAVFNTEVEPNTELVKDDPVVFLADEKEIDGCISRIARLVRKRTE